MNANWPALVEHLAAADRIAYRMVLQGALPTEESIGMDEALQETARLLPDHEQVEEKLDRLAGLIKLTGDAVALEDLGALLAHTEQYAFLLGIAVGARMGRETLTPPRGDEPERDA